MPWASTSSACHRVGESDVREWAARWFTRANAVLMLSGEPADLEVPLDGGDYREIPAARALPYEPVYLETGGGGATVTFAGSRSRELLIGPASSATAPSRCSGTNAASATTSPSARRRSASSATPCSPPTRARRSRAPCSTPCSSWCSASRRRADRARARDDRAAGAREVRAGAIEQLTFTAYAELERRPVLFLEDAVRRDGELAAADVQTAMRDAAATLHAGGNEDMRPPSGFAPPAAPPAREHPGETFPGRRLMSREKVVLGPDAISLVEKNQQRTTIDRCGVAILGIRSATERVVIDVDATSIGFDGREFRRGDELVAALDAWIPAHLHVPFAADRPSRDGGRGSRVWRTTRSSRWNWLAR